MARERETTTSRPQELSALWQALRSPEVTDAQEVLTLVEQAQRLQYQSGSGPRTWVRYTG